MGLQPGDVIIALDGEDISGMEDLRKRVMQKRVGKKLRVKFQRGDDVFEGYVELMPAP